MRTLFATLALLMFMAGPGQQIELMGKYSASFIGGETIEFVKKDSFYFNGYYCTVGAYGKGRCTIRGNYLYLYFEKSKNKTASDSIRQPAILKQETGGEFCALNITCVDNDGYPIAYASMVLRKDGKIIKGANADDSGSAKFKVDRINFPISVDITSVQAEPGKIILADFANYTIKSFHKLYKPGDKELNNGEVYIYEIDEISEDFLRIRPKGSKTTFRTYQKQ